MAQITHWHILGAGSMGCLWAYYLSKAKHSVTLIARNEQHRQQLHTALPLTLIKSSSSTTCNLTIVTPEKCKPIDHLLICLKAYQTANGIDLIRPLVSNAATIVLLQNGMGNQQLLLDSFPTQAIYAAITTEAAYRQETLLIEHTGTGITQLGNLSQQKDDQLLRKISCALTTVLNKDIEAALWQKLVINCCINPLTAIYRCKNGQLADIPQAQQSIKKIIAECKLVATAMGKQHYLDNIEQQVADVILSTAKNTSSMLQDTLNQQPTEIAYMNGYIVTIGAKNHIHTPENNSILRAIKR